MSTTKIYKQLYTHWPKLAIITLLYFPQKHFQTKNNRSQIFFVPMPVPILLLFSWRQRHPTPVLLPGKSRGRRSLVGCSPWGYEESDTTEQLHFHFSLSCTGEGNGNPLQCSCLENPRDGGAWGAAIYGVAQSWTRLKRLSSSSSRFSSPIILRLYGISFQSFYPFIYTHIYLRLPRWH